MTKIKPIDARELLLACSVCLRRHAGTAKERLVRHGFAVVGTGHGRGHLGAWHTGPCWGADHPHLGISPVGTRLALARVREELEMVARAALRLDDRPALRWSREITNYAVRPRTTRTEWRDVVSGDKRTLLHDTGDSIPDYDDLLRSKRQELDLRRIELRRSEAEYERINSTWTPEAYAPVPRPAKIAIRHLAATWARGSKNSPMNVGLCSQYAMRPSYRATTTDRALVTCSRCLKAVGPAQASKGKEATP